mgnify:CR=1 FL=1
MNADKHRCFSGPRVLMVRDKNFWKIFERTKCGPKGEGQEARNKNANNANTTKGLSATGVPHTRHSCEGEIKSTWNRSDLNSYNLLNTVIPACF